MASHRTLHFAKTRPSVVTATMCPPGAGKALCGTAMRTWGIVSAIVTIAPGAGSVRRQMRLRTDPSRCTAVTVMPYPPAGIWPRVTRMTASPARAPAVGCVSSTTVGRLGEPGPNAPAGGGPVGRTRNGTSDRDPAPMTRPLLSNLLLYPVFGCLIAYFDIASPFCCLPARISRQAA